MSSTAAATLRQLVMFVVDKMDVEDRVSEDAELQDSQLTEVQLPDGTTKKLGPSALDAFSVFEDLCLLANSEKPHFLKLEFLHKTFALELIESVLTNYHQLFRKVAILSEFIAVRDSMISFSTTNSFSFSVITCAHSC